MKIVCDRCEKTLRNLKREEIESTSKYQKRDMAKQAITIYAKTVQVLFSVF